MKSPPARMELNPLGRILIVAMVLPVFFSSCTSEPLLSRRGGVAAAELAVQSLVALGRNAGNPVERNLEDSDVNYVGGIIPVKKHRSERARPIEKGTRLLVDGHARGPIPLIANLPKPGPHTLRLEIPGWQPYTFKLEKSFRLRVGEGEIESWTPLLANCKTGQIFTAEKLPSFEPYQSAGAGGTPGTQFKLGKDPMLVVTTTDHRRLRGFSKIGDMKPLAAPR